MKTQSLIPRITCPKTMARRLRAACATRLLPLLLLLALPAVLQAQYDYTINNGGITITGYTGPGGDVTIPKTMNGLPVTSIGDTAFYECTNLTSVTIPSSVTSIQETVFYFCTALTNIAIPNSVTNISGCAFFDCTSLTSVTIPNSVTNIGGGAFAGCTSLTAIMVDTNNPAYSSLDGVLFNKSQTTLIQYPASKAGTSYTVPSSVTSIEGGFWWTWTSIWGGGAFGDSSLTSVTIGTNVTSIADFAFGGSALTSVTIPSSVTNVGWHAFLGCTSLTSVCFRGNAPSFGFGVFGPDFDAAADPATIYYLPGTTGWDGVSTNTGLPVAVWTPQVQTRDVTFGVRTNQFGFTINWASGMTVVVEASTNLLNSTWYPLQTNTLTSDSFYFSDPQWANYPGRFYRLRWP